MPNMAQDVEDIVASIQDELERSYLAGADDPGGEPPKHFGCIPNFRDRIATLRRPAEQDTFGSMWILAEIRRVLGMPTDGRGIVCARYLDAIAALRAFHPSVN